jgi:formylglycine-generating enzyme required for sulfatase activity
MGQGGNVYEWNESAFDGTNSSPSENRANRGGAWVSPQVALRSSFRLSGGPAGANTEIGFRVASVPEPSTYALLAMTAAGALWMTKRRR